MRNNNEADVRTTIEEPPLSLLVLHKNIPKITQFVRKKKKVVCTLNKNLCPRGPLDKMSRLPVHLIPGNLEVLCKCTMWVCLCV